MGMEDLPPVTLMFTDIQGSTRLLRSLGDDTYQDMQFTLAGLLRSICEAHGGQVLDTQGDSLFVVFRNSPLDGVSASLECQRSLASYAWPAGHDVRIRIGVHTGCPKRIAGPSGDTYVGLDVHRAARLCEAGHGGQILISDPTRECVTEHLPEAINIRPLGEHQLRDLPSPEPIFQVVAPGIAPSFPPLRALDLRFFNLPVTRTPLLGRDQALAELHSQLSQTNTGLITLCGPAGTGKTRLAIAVASLATDLFKDGICFVALAPVGDPELVLSMIVRRLGLQESGAASLEEMLLGHLRNRQLLLILDNFEHLLPAASLVADLLAACPKLKILVTSRTVLRIQGEHEYVVPPLGFPQPVHLPPYHNFDRYPAIALFAERAAMVASGFKVTPENFEAITKICARLDGLPLAIELAAARASHLTPTEMLARLGADDYHASLDLLTVNTRDAPSRHRTLRAAIGWSYGLLDPHDQELFRQLAVFVGGFTFAAIPAVAILPCLPAGPSQVAPSASAALDGIRRLVESSLLQRVERPGCEARFAMLETIREYGLECLEVAGEIAKIRQRHAAHFLALSETGENQVGGARQAEWLAQLDDEHANFRAALAWLLSGDEGNRLIGAQLAGALWVFWFRRAYLREGSRWIQLACANCETMPSSLRAKLLTADGSFARMVGDFSRGEVLLETATGLWRDLGDAEGIAWALSHLGLVKQWLGQLDTGVELLEESLALRLAAGDQRGIARSLFHLAITEDFRLNYSRAAHLYE